MKFYETSCALPETYNTNSFLFRPLRTTDVELDYQAVMSSASKLRIWSQSDWPRDGFTLEENLADLAMHEEEHHAREAFTYTVMDPEQNVCLGCIYMRPILQEVLELGVCSEIQPGEDLYGASIRFWGRQTPAIEELEAGLINALLDWLETDWYFRCLVFPITPSDPNQVDLFIQHGFSYQGRIYHPTRKTQMDIYQLG